jgi:hypothetical protein
MFHDPILLFHAMLGVFVPIVTPIATLSMINPTHRPTAGASCVQFFGRGYQLGSAPL